MKTLDIMLAFAGGALIGAGVAVLLTPKSGREVRGQLRDFAETSKEKVARVPRAIRGAYTQASEAAREGFADLYRDPIDS
jgi:gas vesicle protein